MSVIIFLKKETRVFYYPDSLGPRKIRRAVVWILVNFSVFQTVFQCRFVSPPTPPLATGIRFVLR